MHIIPNIYTQSRKMLHFLSQRATIPYLIGLTHTDYPDAWEAEDIALALDLHNQETRPPIININPTQPESVREALITLGEVPQSISRLKIGTIYNS